MKKPDLLTEKPSSALLRLMWPMLMGIAAIMFFNIVDTFYVGQLGTNELAAMGFTFPVIFVIFSITMGLGIGITAVISKMIGSGKKEEMQRTVTDALILGLCTVLIVSFFGFISIDALFSLLGADPVLLPLIKEYMQIWYAGIGLMVIPMLGNSAIRATGDTKTPSLIMVVSGILNLILDPFLIFGLAGFPKLGLAGAALASVFSWIISLAGSFWILTKREYMISFAWPKKDHLFSSWRSILHIGLPAAGTNMLVPLSTGILVKMMSGFGAAAIAAFGVGIRLESLAMMGIMAMSAALIPFVGQNHGAGLHKRIDEGVRFSLRFAFLWGGIAWVVFAGGAKVIAPLFNDNPVVIMYITHFLWIIPLTYGLYGISLLVGAGFNALHKPWYATMLIVLRLFVFAIPFAYLGMRWWDVEGLFVGIAIANVFIGAIAYSWIKKFFKLEHST